MTFEEIMTTDTKKMTAEEFAHFMKETAIPAMNEEWGEGGYLIMMCDTDDITIAQLCEECGLPKWNHYYFALSPDVMASDKDLEDFILVDGYDDNDFGFPMARDVEDCIHDEDPDIID